MKITVIGSGHMALVTGACLAEFGLDVVCMDKDEKRINRLKEGNAPFYEPGLDEFLERNLACGRLSFSNNIEEAIGFSKVIFLAVDTSSSKDHISDQMDIICTVRDIAHYMDDYKTIVIKSTVPVGTGRLAADEIRCTLQKLGKNTAFGVAVCPEFIKKGTAIFDFINPDRIVIGAEDDRTVESVLSVYASQIITGNIPVVVTTMETAEMIKYVSNAFLSVKISFANEIAQICELCGVDINSVVKGIGLDNRIGQKSLNPGPGYGGTSLPRDMKALMDYGSSLGYVPKILKSTSEVNDHQKNIILKKIKKAARPIANKTITVLGVAYKTDTDDIAESPAVYIIKMLMESNARIRVCDPIAADNLKKSFPELDIEYYSDVYTACEGSNCIVLHTKYNQFCNLDFAKLKAIMKTAAFIDLRNVYEPDYVRKAGFTYQGIGRL